MISPPRSRILATPLLSTSLASGGLSAIGAGWLTLAVMLATSALSGCTWTPGQAPMRSVGNELEGIEYPELHRGLVNNLKTSPDSGQGTGRGSGP